VPALAVVGNLSLDRVDGGPPRAGGAPFWAARALRVLGAPALVAVKCALEDRRVLAPPLVALGLPVVWLSGESTAAFSFRYSGDLREMVVDAVGSPWTAEDVRGLQRVRWVHVGALASSDFPAETLAELARGRVVSFDGQGLVRPARTGPLELAVDADLDALRHVSLVLADGRLAHVPAQPVGGPVDPTGAGDAFSAAYLVARSSGHAPAAAARRATALVTGLLAHRLR
jgi:hypothetical protein